jgi:hypothetical protein
MRFIALIIASALMFACSSSVPRGIIPPDEMKQIVFDLVRADQFIDNFVTKDTTANVKERRITLYEQVFAIHKVSREEFYKSYTYYQQNPDKNKVLFDSLNAYGNRKKAVPVKPLK